MEQYSSLCEGAAVVSLHAVDIGDEVLVRVQVECGREEVGAALAVATPWVHGDCFLHSSSLPVAEHADTTHTRNQLAHPSQVLVAGPLTASQNVAVGGSYLANSPIGPDTVPHVPSTPHNGQTCLTPCANDPCARARIAAAQSGVAAPTLSDPRQPPPCPTLSLQGRPLLQQVPAAWLLPPPLSTEAPGSSLLQLTRFIVRILRAEDSDAQELPRATSAPSPRPHALRPQATASRAHLEPAHPRLPPTQRWHCQNRLSRCGWTFRPSTLLTTSSNVCALFRPTPRSTFPRTAEICTIAIVERCWGDKPRAWTRKAHPNGCWHRCQEAQQQQTKSPSASSFWEQSEFETLLQRLEQNKLLNHKHRKRKRQPQRDDPAGRGDRATHCSSGRLSAGHL